MKKYKRKPIIHNAFQLSYHGSPVWPEWFNKAWEDETVFVSAGELFIRTLEGPMRISDGDYIVEGVKGELWPVKPDIFELTYEECDA